MKKFIQKRLRDILEGRLASHTPSNPVGQDPKRATNANLIKTTHRIVSLNNEYGQDEYFQNPHEGDGIYMATIHTNGAVTIKTPNTQRKITDSDIGMLSTGTGGNKHVFIKAYRGIEHPELHLNRTGHTKTKSPANDAAIKTYLIFAQEIIQFVKQNMEGNDDYTSDEKDFKSKTDDKWQYKYDKYQKAQDRSKSTITMDPDKAAEMERRQKELQAKYDKINQRRNKLT